MPAKDIHIAKAVGNEVFVNSLTLDTQAKVDWALIATFYAALHYVEAYLALTGQHITSHTTRDNVVGRDSVLKRIYTQYQDLKFFGFNARYQPPMFKAKQVSAEALPTLETIKATILPKL